MELKISIIIPVYNTQSYVSKCIDSCLNQDLGSEEYEIILIDDGSTDNSLDILLEYQDKYKTILVLTQENKKQGAARNHGLRHAQGEFIWFVDSDDWIEPNSLIHLYNQGVKNNLDVLAFGAADITEFTGKNKNRVIGYQKNKIYEGREVLIEDKFNVNLPLHLFRKEFLIEKKLQLLKNIYFEDNEFMIRVFDKVDRFMYIDFICYNVLLRQASTTRTTNFLNFFGMIKVIQSLIKYVEGNYLPNEAERVFARHIARCQNSILYATRDSKEYFHQAVNDLKQIKGLKSAIFKSRSIFHIFQFGLLHFPSFLRRILVLYYK